MSAVGSEYTPYYELEAVGNRIGIATCLRCGAAIVIDKEGTGPQVHEKWHREQAAGDADASKRRSE